MNQIVIYPNKILREKAEKIIEVDKKLLEDIKNLVEIIDKGDNAAGLAANQIGIKKRFFGLKGDNKKTQVFVNPEITKTYGKKDYSKMVAQDNKESDFLEGCLSLPGLYGTVKRYFKIEIRWQEIVDKKLVNKTNKLEGYEAIVFQHELDHLNGVLFIDHIKEDKGKLYKMVGEKMVEWGLDF